MKVLLIDPPGSVVGINSGLGYLSGALRNEGIFTRVLDFNNYRSDIEERLKKSLEEGYGLIGLSIKTNTIGAAVDIARLCRRFSDSPLVAGGPGVSIAKGAFLKEHPVFDYILTGEAERTIGSFAKAIHSRGEPFDVPGLGYRRGQEITVNRAETPLDLDALPLPDYSAFDMLSFRKNSYPLVTSRGCPYDCVYCSVSAVSGKRFRARSAQDVVRELKAAKKIYGIRNFQVYDDTFTQDIRRAKEICRRLKDEWLGLSWVCQNGIRADRLDGELLGLMKDAGCGGVWFGVESLDEEVFAGVNKGEEVSDILRAISLAKEAGIPISAFFIIGLPSSNYRKDIETLKKAKRLDLNLTTWSLATPYPYTALWDWVEKNGRVLRDYRDVSFFADPQCVFDTDDYTEKERLRVLYKANLAFSRYECISSERNPVKRVFKILKVTLKYDPAGLPQHILLGLALLTKKMAGIKRK